MHIRTAIIPIAGYGTRLLPATKVIPKAMLPVGDRPILHHVVMEAAASGIRRIIFVTGSGIGKEIVKKYFGRHTELERVLRKQHRLAELRAARTLPHGMRLVFVQQPKMFGNADAIARALRVLRMREPIAVLFGDDLVSSSTPALYQLIQLFLRRQCAMVAVARVPRAALARYGAISGKRIGKNLYDVQHIIEKPRVKQMREVQPYAIIGRYILPSDIQELITQIAREHMQKRHWDREISLTDALVIYMKRSKVCALRVSGEWFDCGNREGFLRANMHFSVLGQRTERMQGSS